MKFQKLFVLLVLYLAVYADEATIGLALIDEGNFDEGRLYIHRAYKKDPDAPHVQYAYAQTVADGLEARNRYKRVADNKAAPDSLRAKAFRRLGRYYYCNEDYDSAQMMFTQAVKLVPADVLKHLKAMAIINRGDNRAAEKIWLAMVSRGKEKDALNHARYYLGNALYQQGKYEDAYNCYHKAGESEKRSWTIAAKAGACLAAHHTGDRERSTILYDHIQKEYPILLEKEDLEAVFSTGVTFSEVDIDIPSETPVKETTGGESRPEQSDEDFGTANQGFSYTLQVGAFSSQENARNMMKKMKKDFKHVSIKDEMVNGKQFFKVRIGSFTKEEDARAYGEKELAGRGLTYRVVRE